jgi:lipopolysaccharide heptosyltransferase I
MLNILILRVSAIGDVIHTLPCVFLLKQLLPNVRISWVVQQKAASLLVGQPFLEAVYILPDHFLYPKNISTTLRVVKKLRATKWDGIFDFQGLSKTSLLIAFLQGKKYGFDKKNARWPLSTWFTHHQTSPTFTNIVQKNLSLAASAAFDLAPHQTCPAIHAIQPFFEFSMKPAEITTVDTWFKQNGDSEFIALCPNTTWASKHWPLEHWVALAKKLALSKHLVVVGTTFGDAAKNLAAKLLEANVPFVAMPAWNLTMTGYALKRASLVLAPDTGLLHLCDYLGVKTIGIFGPTAKKQHGPFLDKDNVQQALQISCQHFYKKEHGDGSIDCMALFTPDDMLLQISHALKIDFFNNQAAHSLMPARKQETL